MTWKFPSGASGQVSYRFDPIDTEKLQANLWRLFGEAYQEYLDWRERQPHGPLWLDLQSKEVVLEAEAIAEASRRRTATELIAAAIQEWLDEPVEAQEAFVDSKGMPDDDYANDETLMVRNMVTPKEAYEALRMEPHMQPYRNADLRTYGKAMKLLSGWRELGKVRRHGQGQAQWFCRGEDGPRWVEHVAPEQQGDDGEDPLLG